MTDKTKILLIANQAWSLGGYTSLLAAKGYEIIHAANALESQVYLSGEKIDLILLDVLLPDVDALALCREITNAYDIPVICLSALDEPSDVATGLRAGGSDYISRRCDAEVFLARVEARLREAHRKNRFIQFGRLRLDVMNNVAVYGANELKLPPREFSVLLLLANYTGAFVTSEMLYAEIWGQPMCSDGKALWTVISRLKKKLKATTDDMEIVSSRSEGYMLRMR